MAVFHRYVRGLCVYLTIIFCWCVFVGKDRLVGNYTREPPHDLQAPIASAVSRTENRTFTYDGVSPELLSKFIVVRRAYFDNRKRNGHKNAVVFTLEMKRSLVKSNIIIGCRVGSVVSSQVHFRQSEGYKWAIWNIHVTKNVAFLDCFDVNDTDIKDGDPAFLIIRPFHNGSSAVKQVEVKSQRNVVVPESRKDLKSSHPSVVACVTTVRLGEIPPSEDGMLYQWLRYQKTIGVDHVHMIAEDTFVTKGDFEHPIIQNALKENYLSIDFWPRWFNETELYHSSQHLASNDCVYRFQGVYDYIIIADSDDFFVPRGKSKPIKTYLKKYCSGKVASCIFRWHQFYPDGGWSPESVGPDGNLTATVHCKYVKQLKGTKSGYQIHTLIEVGRHDLMNSLPGYKRYALVPAREAYFAHLRKRLPPPKGVCKV